MSEHLDGIDADINHFNQLYPGLDNDNLVQYFTSDTFNRKYSKSNNDLSLIHVNIQSFFGKNHHDQFFRHEKSPFNFYYF